MLAGDRLDLEGADRPFAGTQLAAFDERARPGRRRVWGRFDRSNCETPGFDAARLRMCGNGRDARHVRESITA